MFQYAMWYLGNGSLPRIVFPNVSNLRDSETQSFQAAGPVCSRGSPLCPLHAQQPWKGLRGWQVGEHSHSRH